MAIDKRVQDIYESFYIVTPLDFKYYNIVSTEDEIILDFKNRSFKPWIIKSGEYITNEYDEVSIENIKKRNDENIVINRRDIEEIKFSKRTFLKNAFLEIKLKDKDKVITLITKEKLQKEMNL